MGEEMSYGVRPISSVDEDMIILLQYKTSDQRDGVFFLGRKQGTLSTFTRQAGGANTNAEGPCEKVAFIPFPAPEVNKF